jgi:hypothetical protein
MLSVDPEVTHIMNAIIAVSAFIFSMIALRLLLTIKIQILDVLTRIRDHHTKLEAIEKRLRNGNHHQQD